MNNLNLEFLFQYPVYFISDNFLFSSFHSSCFHNNSVLQWKRVLVGKIKQCECDSYQQSLLLFFFQAFYCIAQLFMLIQVEAALFMATHADQFTYHKYEG